MLLEREKYPLTGLVFSVLKISLQTRKIISYFPEAMCHIVVERKCLCLMGTFPLTTETWQSWWSLLHLCFICSSGCLGFGPDARHEKSYAPVFKWDMLLFVSITKAHEDFGRCHWHFCNIFYILHKNNESSQVWLVAQFAFLKWRAMNIF